MKNYKILEIGKGKKKKLHKNKKGLKLTSFLVNEKLEILKLYKMAVVTFLGQVRKI